jgi:secreted PhoX family phosphatase
VPIDANHPFGDVFSDNQLKLHTPGTSWPVQWVTIHDTAVDGTADFDANAAAKKAGATPFKRPENGQFLPGSGFNTFFFDATGDTDSTAGNVPALAARGSWGSIFRLDLNNADEGEKDNTKAAKGTAVQNGRKSKSSNISIFVLGDQFHAAFDNLTFVDEHMLLAGEDRGDTLHDQLNMLDSVWAYDVRKSRSQGVRFIALGQDSQSAPVGQEDNEPTGLHASDGDSTVEGIVGKPTHPEDRRLFFTQQHGENQVWEIQGSTEDKPKKGKDK